MPSAVHAGIETPEQLKKRAWTKSVPLVQSSNIQRLSQRLTLRVISACMAATSLLRTAKTRYASKLQLFCAMAADKVFGRNFLKLRRFNAALVNRELAARMEVAARGRVRGVRYLALKNNSIGARPGIRLRHSGQQRCRVRVLRFALCRRAPFPPACRHTSLQRGR